MRSAVVAVTQRSKRAAHGRRWPAPALPRPPNLILDLRAQRGGERHRREAGGVTVSGRPLAPARPRTYSPTLFGTVSWHRRALGTGPITGLGLSLAGGDAAPSAAASVRTLACVSSFPGLERSVRVLTAALQRVSHRDSRPGDSHPTLPSPNATEDPRAPRPHPRLTRVLVPGLRRGSAPHTVSVWPRTRQDNEHSAAAAASISPTTGSDSVEQYVTSEKVDAVTSRRVGQE